MPKPFNELSGKFLKTVNDRINRMVHKPKKPEEFKKTTKTMLNNIAVHIERNKGSIEHLKTEISHDTEGWVKNLRTIRGNYTVLYDIYSDLINEEKAINRIETKAYVRALFFRFLTTLGIGFGIMLIYYLAQKWGINMPLMRGVRI